MSGVMVFVSSSHEIWATFGSGKMKDVARSLSAFPVEDIKEAARGSQYASTSLASYSLMAVCAIVVNGRYRRPRKITKKTK